MVAASAATTACVLRHHISEQSAGIDGVVLGYGHASDLMRAVAERIADPHIRAGIINHLKAGMVKALEVDIGEDGLLVE